jgi:hypothetical protein
MRTSSWTSIAPCARLACFHPTWRADSLQINTVFNQHNIWANIQPSAVAHQMSFRLGSSRGSRRVGRRSDADATQSGGRSSPSRSQTPACQRCRLKAWLIYLQATSRLQSSRFAGHFRDKQGSSSQVAIEERLIREMEQWRLRFVTRWNRLVRNFGCFHLIGAW